MAKRGLDEHIHSRINQSIATDCRTFRLRELRTKLPVIVTFLAHCKLQYNSTLNSNTKVVYIYNTFHDNTQEQTTLHELAYLSPPIRCALQLLAKVRHSNPYTQ